MSILVQFLALLFIYLFQDAVSFPQCDEPKNVIVCYYGSWSIYRSSSGKFDVENIDPKLCTHVIYSFAGLDIFGHIASDDEWNDLSQNGYKNFTTHLKEKNPCVKTILAVGGWNELSRKFSVMASTEQSRTDFVEGVLKYVVFYGFDGIDVDWEYPTQRGGISVDKDNFSDILKKLRNRFTPWGLTISIAVPLSTKLAQNAYDITAIKDVVDYVHLMAYDYTSSDSPVTGLLAPLTPIKESIAYWTGAGLNAKKLVLGLPIYARTFVLQDRNKHDIGAPVIGPARPGTYTLQKGFLGYYELEAQLKTLPFQTMEEDTNCYAYYKGVWFTFDSLKTFAEKTNFAIKSGLAGVMLWSIDTDDFVPLYADEKFPVLSTVYNVTQTYS